MRVRTTPSEVVIYHHPQWHIEENNQLNQEMSGELSDFSDLREAAIRAVDSVIEDGEQQLEYVTISLMSHSCQRLKM